MQLMWGGLWHLASGEAAPPGFYEGRADHLPGDKLVGNFLLLHTYVLSWEVILDLTVSSYHAFIK